MISAKIICDSINKDYPGRPRLTTFIVTFPRIVLSEFNTHKMISKNSASSRAIPFAKMLESVKSNPFIPIKWMKEHKGMQGSEYVTDEKEIAYLTQEWLNARDYACQQAELLNDAKVTKQICNRLLEPFLWHTVLCTATDWENFFALRAHEAAEIHIADLAYKMLEAYNASEPKELLAGEWHIPFGDNVNESNLFNLIRERKINNQLIKEDFKTAIQNIKLKISAARAARLSYNNFDGIIDIEKDVALADNLLKQGHLSPFEHSGQAVNLNHYDYHETTNDCGKYYEQYSGNFCPGWLQYRKTFENENRRDSRVLKK